ncbi:methyltransferase domain-containing protein [Methylobacterium sp. WL69]|uniref:class I SAM-dependent methyltransferase n=1 Tax=Methylobacterium sp. WL69 TaxID=2603893 RepID=UPI0011C8905A|nr:methyltransferase domain-containing protein [Methylobacterium sp. WL69]TXM74534.1 methyltransferase domain-containing protein [Methylobacterium sp. WL69]
MTDLPRLPPEAFAKQDRTPDALFYAQPRLVTHIDDAAINAVTDLYRTLLPPGGRILDLMSSWVSHLPAEVAYGAVIGHGLNAQELTANARLTQHFVQDLNADPILPLNDTSIDAALICVGVQYLQNPVAVLRQVARVLVPGAPVIITFSNRCFPTKAVAIWQALGGDDHARLIALYLQHAGFSAIEARVLLPEGGPTDPLRAVIGRTSTLIADAQ